MTGLIILVVLVVVALLAPLLAPFNPDAISGSLLNSPSGAHFFGTDNVGKDVFSGVVHGARVSLLVGISVALGVLLLGTIVGSIAGYYGGRIDGALMRIAELFQIMPSFILALVMVALLGGGIGLVILAISISVWPRTARIVRSQFWALRNREFVEAARAMGFGDFYIIRSEILPNAIPPAIVQATLDIGAAILLAAGLSFLGLGDPNVQSWGEMLNRAQPYLSSAWWMSVFPGAAIFITVLAFNLAGDGLNDALSPSDRQRT